VYQSSVRSATAGMGKTFLALLAVLSLLLSAFAIARPVIAHHSPPDGPEVPAQNVDAANPGIYDVNQGGNVACPSGTVELKFEGSGGDLANGPHAGSTTVDGVTVDVSFNVSGGTITSFVIENGLAALVSVKASNESNVYDYRGNANSGTFPGPGIAHDDGLVSPTGGGISNVVFCLIPAPASLIVYKTDQLDNDVAGAEFKVYEGATLKGTQTTNSDGIACFDGLKLGVGYTVVETAAPAGWNMADPDTQTNIEAKQGTCADRLAGEFTPDATFVNERVGSLIVLKTDTSTAATALAGAWFKVNDGTAQETGENGRTCFDGLVAGEKYSVTETAPPPGHYPADPATVHNVEAGAGTCADRAQDAPDVTFTNAPVGSLIVLKTDDNENAEERVALAGAWFKVDDGDAQETGEDGTTCFDGLVAGQTYTVTETAPPPGYLPADPDSKEATAGAGTCDERTESAPDVVFTNAAEEEELGSVTILKDLGECEICETATPGRWFNFSPGTDTTPGTAFANASLGADPITVAGITFSSVADVHANASPGSLLWHWLGLQMNVRWGESADCDLLELVYMGDDEALHGWTVEQILAEAKSVLEGGASAYSAEQLKDAIDEINNSNVGDGTLVCPAESGGVAGAGFEFELWVASDYPNDPPGPVDSGTTDGAGALTFSGLTLGVEYLIVEVGGPDPDLTCWIVDATGDGVSFDAETGQITFTLTENTPDLTIEVTNVCVPDEEEEFEVDLVKVDQEDMPIDGVTFTLEGDMYFAEVTSADGGQIRFEGLLAGDYTLTETVGAPGCETDGPWSLTVGADGSFTFDPELTMTEGGAFVIVNLCEEDDEEGWFEIDKIFCPTTGEDRTDVFVFGPAGPEPIGTMGVDEDDDFTGCEIRDGVEFTITGAGGFTLPIVVDGGTATFPHPVGEFTITEDSTGASANYEIEAGLLTAVLFINYEGEEELGTGLVKIIKLACTGPEDGVVMTVLPGDHTTTDLPAGAEDCEPSDASFRFDDGTSLSSEFTVGDDGFRLVPVTVGTYTLHETQPYQGESSSFEVTDGGIVTVIVFNLFEGDVTPGEGEQPGQPQQPGEGTLPDTATAPGPIGSVPAALLALVMLTGLGAAAYTMQAEARRRR
jgi:hypothetical protein